MASSANLVQHTMQLPEVRYGDVHLKPSIWLAQKNGEDLALPPQEYALLYCLVEAKGSVVPHHVLIERFDSAMKIRGLIARLRGKSLGIENVSRVGYRIL